MLKKFLLGFMIFSMLPIYAGELEKSLNNNQDVFLYLYTSFCGTCKQFNPIYENVEKNNSNRYKFFKINAETPYGYSLARRYRIAYVPFVALINSKKVWQLDISCLVDTKCTDEALSKFKNN